MYEHMTFEYILQRMLNRVPASIDKRQGSVIYDACAPAASELAQMYIELDINYNLSFADTASGEYLTRKAAEFGVNRETATKARRKGLFYAANQQLLDVPLGGRYSIGNLNYVVLSKRATGEFVLECEEAGVIGNQQFGALLPIEYVANLARAELLDILVPGEDDETDESLRQRLYDTVNEPAFGGNVADYKNKINAIAGVGATKVYPAWNGGGTVKCTIIASDWSVPSSAFVDEVQTIIDPTLTSGEGNGAAPIGHVVTIAGVTSQTINIETSLTLASGVTQEQVQAEIEAVVESYLLDLRKDWVNQQKLIIRTAQIDARLLTIASVEDVTDTKINGEAANLTLSADEIPMLGAVVING